MKLLKSHDRYMKYVKTFLKVVLQIIFHSLYIFLIFTLILLFINIHQNTDCEWILSVVIAFIAKNIHVLIMSHNTLEIIFLSPLLEIEYSVPWKVKIIIKIIDEVLGHSSDV